jgi:hypothetical protein
MRISRALLIYGLTLAGTFAGMHKARAIPAFAVQTGMKCSACHVGFAQLTPYGREFKLQGYVAGGMFPSPKNLAVGLQAAGSFLHRNTPGPMKPGFKSNDVIAAQQVSLYYGGALDARVGLGAFIQFTYSGVNHALHWDLADIRLARPGKLLGKSMVLGLTFNNAPSVTDLWNSTPVWNYQFIHSNLAPQPTASPAILTLGTEVYGFGGYDAINLSSSDLLYAEADFYKSLPHRAGERLGAGPVPALAGVAPYWRLALQHDWGDHSLEAGTFGFAAHPYPQGISVGGPDTIVDLGLDTQFQWIDADNAVSFDASFIHEHDQWNASYRDGLTANPDDWLNTGTATLQYLWRQKVGVIGSYVRTYGSRDTLIYGPAPVSGSANGKPNTTSWTTELDYYPFNNGGPKWLPWLNAKIFVQNTYYPQFNGGARNYDGYGRNSGSNDVIFTGIWLLF